MRKYTRDFLRTFSTVFVLFLGLISSYYFSAQGHASESTKAFVDKTFTFRLTGEPETLDWNRAHTPIETYVLMNVMEGLMTFDSKMKIVPALAEKYSVSADGKTYTFKIRKKVLWSDGVELKAKDFVFSWKRLLSAITAAPYSYFLFDIEGAEDFFKGKNKDFSSVGIRAVDDSTLEVKLIRPIAHWIEIPTFWVTFPLREDIVSKYGDSWAKPGSMVVLGPYQYASYDIDSKIVLKSNPKYYGKHGNIEQAVGLIVKDDMTALNLYESGKLDLVTDIAPTELKRLEKNEGMRKFPYLKTVYLGFASNHFPVSNAHVRRAIGMAIDRTQFGAILHGGQDGATSFIPPNVLAHSKSIGLKFNPQEAKNELKKGGIETGQAVQLDLVTGNWDKPVLVSQFIQEQLKKNLGLEVTLQPFDNKTFRAQLDLKKNPLFLTSWSADYPDPDNFISMFLSTSGNNRTAWKSTTYDEKTLKARASQSPKEREKLYSELQKQLQEEEAVILPLYYEPNLALLRPRVKGVEINSLNYLILKNGNL